MAGPREALQRLRAAAEDDRLEALARRHRIRLLAAFGSATDPDWPAPHDLDIAIDFERDADVDLAQVILDLMDLVRFQEIDVLNLSRARANPLVRTSGLGASSRRPSTIRTPSTSPSVKVGALTEATAARVKPSVGTRNMLVHEYLNIDMAQLAEAARRAPDDYGRYVREVADFLLQRGWVRV